MKIATKNKKTKLVNITPLIDVVFILLIFYMLVSQFTNYHQFNVATLKKSSSIEANVIIKIDLKLNDSGQVIYLFNKVKVTWNDIELAIVNMRNKKVILNASSNLSLQQFINVKEKLNKLGVLNLVSQFDANEN